MAEFLTMDEAKSKFGTKGRTNAGLTLGIIGTALAAFAGNNGGCGCGNGGGILGNLFGGNNNCCAMQAAENAKTLAMAQGQQADLFARLSTRISDLEKKEAATAAALPLMFELNKVNAERYTDACCCKSETNLLMTANGLQRQLDHKIDGQLKYAYSDLCAPVPSIAPLYCSPFTSYGTGMYAGTAASNFNAVNTAINTVTGGCPSCTAQ